MRSETFRADSLVTLFRRRLMATMQEMKTTLGTSVEMTVFRKLRQLSYRSSYSHRGKYYALEALAEFDERGLWTCRGVHFSRFGSLIDTVEQFVTHSERGWVASELAAELQVQVKEPLLKLVVSGRLTREEVSGQFVYCAAERAKSKEQLRQRRRDATGEVPFMRDPLQGTSDETKAAIILFFSTLDEGQRRLYAGLESLRLGHGGDRRLAELTGLDVHTIAKGREELLGRDVRLDRVRRPGGGRHKLEKKTPEVIDAIQALMEHHTAGDPITGLKWTRKTTLKISRELRKAGLVVSPKTVARLLKGLKFSLRVNHKKLAGRSNPYRDRQFQYIHRTRRRFQHQGLPIISIDSKKKEMIGRFKNAGTTWERRPVPVNDHDFKRDAKGTAIPWGLYEIQANRGHMFIGTSHETPTFAVTALARWWATRGRRRYPNAGRLLILADCGGSNGPRIRAWKYQLQTRFINRFGIQVTLCHYPPGTSKWNPIEHRLFSEVSKNWAGQPLESYETMLNFIRTTKTETGLLVEATLLDGDYPTGLKPSQTQMAKVNLRPHRVLPAWNYTLVPAPNNRAKM